MSIGARLTCAVPLLAWLAGASALEPGAQQEIVALLTALERSGCEFYRNGEWHMAGEARLHLEKKYVYLRDKGLIASAEDFIERGATKSSLSGEPYQVRCGTAAAVPSADWLKQLLARQRAQRGR